MLVSPPTNKGIVKRVIHPSDANLFAVCIVPLQLHTKNGYILWQNPRPSSTRYCRPIKLIFEKETMEVTKREIQNIDNQINEIQPTNCLFLNTVIIVKHELKMTMIDGKTFGVISDTCTQTCGICGATPKMMNQLEKIWSLEVKPHLFEYGISNLHAWIRCLECCLHVSYRLELKKRQIRDRNDKQKIKERKTRIINMIKTEMNALIDIPKPGFGTCLLYTSCYSSVVTA